MSKLRRVLAPLALVTGSVLAASAAPPQYQIIDIGVVQGTDFASQGFGISPGGVATGRSVWSSGGAYAFSWTQGGGIVGLPNLASPVRNYSVGNAANDSGMIVGTGSTTLSGSSPLPLKWQGGVVSQLALPTGQTLGRAFGLNNVGNAVGSVNSGSNEVGVIYSGSSASIISTTTSNGSFFRTAYGINNAGLVCGFGIDPTNAAVNVGILYDSASNTTFTVGALNGFNGAIAFGISNGGHVVGSSMLNQGSGLPFIWTQGGGIQAIPLATGTSQGSARGVNASGWAVGTDSSAFAIPFLFDGTQTYRIGDLLVNGAGWDLLTNTSSSAMGISDNGTIVGTGVLNGAIHAYAAVPVPEPMSFLGLAGGGLALAALRRRMKA